MSEKPRFRPRPKGKQITQKGDETNDTASVMKKDGIKAEAVAFSYIPAVQSPPPPHVPFGKVRATPYGACLTDNEDLQAAWQTYRDALPKLIFPKAGFDHVYGQETIDSIDNFDLGEDYGATAAFVQAHEYGSTKTTDDAPIGSLKEKWRMLPHFLQLRGLLRQHIDSFNHFVSVELRQIVQSPSNSELRSDYDPKFYLKYTDCWVGEPSIEEDSYASTQATPFQCRLRDCTYSAPVYVNVRYTRGRQIVVKKKVLIGRMPIMLRSTKCLLNNKTERQIGRAHV